MAIVCQTDLFIRIASCHETRCSTGGTIAPSNLLPPASWRQNTLPIKQSQTKSNKFSVQCLLDTKTSHAVLMQWL